VSHERFVVRHNDRPLLLVRDLTIPSANDRDWISPISNETNEKFERNCFGRAFRRTCK
jgi:hypothetical protein